MITPSNFARTIEPILRDKFGLVYNRWEPEYTKYYEISKSNKMYEEHASAAGFPLFPEKGIGVSTIYTDPKEGFLGRITQTVYALGFKVAYELYLWGQDNRINMMPGALAESATQSIETLGILPFDRAFNASYPGADGTEMCAVNHPRETGGTYANMPTTNTDFNDMSLEQMLLDIAGYTDPAGLKMKSIIDKIVLPPTTYRKAVELLGSPQEPGTSNNAKNFAYQLAPWSTSHYLSSTKAWFVLLKGPNGLVNYVTRKPDLTRDNEFSSETALVKMVFTMAFGHRDPRRIYGSKGA